MSNCVIEAINLNKNFSENSNIVEAVKNVSFTLGKSEIMIISYSTWELIGCTKHKFLQSRKFPLASYAGGEN